MKISAEEIYSVNNSSMKDAVPQFDGGCTAEVISKKGLILTNHHCGFDAIQNHSTIEHDYLTDGFWAYKMEDELRNKGMVVSFVIRIEDITTQVLEGVSKIISEQEKQKSLEGHVSVKQSLPWYLHTCDIKRGYQCPRAISPRSCARDHRASPQNT